MTQHTPGPWVVCELSSFVPRGVKTDCGTCQLICEVMDKWVGLPFVKGTPEANAQLIAAAPELLAACRGALEFIRNGREHGYIRMPDPSTPDRAWGVQPNLEAAIAKAEGTNHA